MQDYRELIANKMLKNTEDMIENLPQPTMFGGKRVRKYVLAGTTDYDYPSTLAVGRTDGSKPETLGGSFWGTLGDIGKHALSDVVVPVATEVGKDALKSYIKGSGGMMVGQDGHGIYNPVSHGYGMVHPLGSDPRTWTPVRGSGRRGRPRKSASMDGGFGWSDISKGLSSVGKVAMPIVKDVGVEVAKDALKSYLSGSGRKPTKKQINILKGHVMQGGFGWKDISKGLSSIGHAVMPIAQDIGKELYPVAKDIAVSAGKDALKNYMSGSTSGAGRRRGRPRKNANMDGGFGWGDIAKGLSSVGKVAMPIVKDVGVDIAKDALKNYMQGSAMPHEVEMLRGAGWIDDLGNIVKTVAPIAMPLMMGLGRKKGGASLMHPEYAQHNHQSVYPPALGSYTAQGGNFIDDLGKVVKTVAPIAMPLMMGLGRKKLPKSGKKRESARGAIVSQVMREKGLNLAQASKYVKEHGLY